LCYFSGQNQLSLKEIDMAFKAYDRNPAFLDMEIQKAVSHPRNKQSLSEIDATINWEPIEKIVMENYPVGQSELGNKAYQLGKNRLVQTNLNDPILDHQLHIRENGEAQDLIGRQGSDRQVGRIRGFETPVGGEAGD
jgi:hypothetical protein